MGTGADHHRDPMTTILTATQVKATILALLDRVADGEEVEITKHGRIVARLVPARGPHALRGSAASFARTNADEEPLYGTGEAWESA